MRLHKIILGAAALAAVCPLVASAQLGFAAAGPVSPDNGFPLFYQDTRGVRLDLCLTDPVLCLLLAPVTLTNPGAAFPNNYGGTFPDESFYQRVDGNLVTNGGGQALLVMALEAAFPAGPIVQGGQTVFGRIRIRVDNLIAGSTYTVTTPLGVYTFVATNAGARGINFTDDIGLVPGLFSGPGSATTSHAGPFLSWDRDLPVLDAAGNEYIGNPALLHTITGSPTGTNLFRIDGPSIGGPGVNRIETNLFTAMGLKSKPAPVAAFTSTPNSGNAPLSVAFTNTSTGPITSHLWSFGDGTTSTLASPTHTYSAGTFTVSLTETGPGGANTVTKTGLIVVANAPALAANFSSTPNSGTAPLNVAFSDASTGTITSRLWTFGDGATSTQTNPTHTYAAGTFTVSLRVTGTGGSNTITKQNLIVVTAQGGPIAGFNSAPNSGTAPLAVAFTDASTGTINSRLWSFGDGATSTQTNPTHTYAAGTFSVSLTVTGPGGSNTLTKPGLIVVTNAQAGIVLANPTPGVAGVVNTLTVTGARPNSSVGFFTGMVLGSSLIQNGRCPGGIAIGLGSPFRSLGTARANAAGVATLATTPPATSAGKVFFFQAIQPDTCSVSNIVTERL